MLRIPIIILFLCFFSGLSAQTLHSKNKKALEAYRSAKEFSDVGNLYESERLLINALRRDKSFDEAILLLHQVYLRRGQPVQSGNVLTDYRSEMEDIFVNRILADRANYFFELGEYGKARKALDQVNGEVFEIPEDIFSLLHRSVHFAVEEIKKTSDIDFQTLPKPLNEFTQQYFPSISAFGKLVFTVRENAGRGNENLYFSVDSLGYWTKPRSISSNINTDRNEGTASIAADGSTLVFTACNIPGNIGSCDLYISYFKGEEWTEPTLLDHSVNSEAWDSQPALSRDGKTLYFVSRREGGLGRQDIWVSELGEDGWSVARNLGPKVNTPYDDCSPYIYIDQKTLFFASKGHIGMGGFDLFSTRLENGGWTSPQNLGYPINNAFDQVGYSVGVDSWAYYSSSGSDGKIELKRFRLPRGVLPSKTPSILAGRVLDQQTLQPLSADITIYGAGKTGIEKHTTTETKTGGFRVFADADRFNIRVKSARYRSVRLDADEFKELSNNDVLLAPIKMGELLAFGDVNFDTNSASIRQEDTNTLENAADFILENPEIVVEIGGHTDLIGQNESNQRLSLERARSVYRYFVEKGVPKENLVYLGYGESKPLITSNTDEARFENRRIELRIIRFLK